MRRHCCWALALVAAAGCAGEAATASVGDDAVTTQAGPRTVYSAEWRFDSFSRFTPGDGVAYVRYWTDSDRFCWGRLLRFGRSAPDQPPDALGTCDARDYTVLDGVVFFAVVSRYGDPSDSGIQAASFDAPDRRAIVRATPVWAITSDATWLYYIDDAAIHRIQADGTNDVVLSAFGSPYSVRLFVDATHVYVLSGATLSRLPKTGGALEPVATFEPGSTFVAVDGGEVWWTTWDDVTSTQRIERMPVSGGTPTTFLASPGSLGSVFVAPDAVYWSRGVLERRGKAGGPIETVVTHEDNVRVVGIGTERVFYSRWAWPAPPRLELRALALADVVPPRCDVTPRPLATAGIPTSLSAAGTWVHYTADDTVRRVWKNGGADELLVAGQPGARSIDAGGAFIAWVTDTGIGAWLRVPTAAAADAVISSAGSYYLNDGPRLLDAGGVELATGGAPYRLAVDETTLFWSDRADGSVRRVATTGGRPAETILRLPRGIIGELALDATHVYVAFDLGGAGRILRVAKTGGAPEVVARGGFSASDLEVVGDHLFFTSDGPGPKTIYRVAKTGDVPIALTKDGPAFDLDALGGCLYYTTGDGIRVVSQKLGVPSRSRRAR